MYWTELLVLYFLAELYWRLYSFLYMRVLRASQPHFAKPPKEQEIGQVLLIIANNTILYKNYKYTFYLGSDKILLALHLTPKAVQPYYFRHTAVAHLHFWHIEKCILYIM